MKYIEYTRFDKQIMAIMFVPYVLITCYVIYGNGYFHESRIFWLGTFTLLVFWFVEYQGMKMIALVLRKRYPEYNQLLRRIVVELCFFIPITGAFMLAFYGVLSHYHYLGTVWQTSNALWLLLIGVIANILATALNEGAYTFEKWKDTMVETEELKKANVQSRLESLKNQVNPHFLFNSLNSLSSLINDDPEQAEKFLDEMTKVYRYLLRNNEQELTTLATELKFLQSYFHLLKTRYGEGIELEMAIMPELENYLIPPLTLQLLVENAVKHNVILKEKPLHISIETFPAEQLVIRNSLQRKTVHVASNKVGLTNIAAKYKLMNQPDILIAETATHFSITLPLIKPEQSVKPAHHEAV